MDASRGVRAEMLAACRAMVPALGERAARAERDRAIPAETHRAFLEAGLYRIFQPARYGGYEMDLTMMVDVAAELGRGCGSSSWIFTNLAMQAWINGMKDPRAQEELWADDRDAQVASSFPGKDAKVRQVDGGIVVSGTWHYASGVDFAEWNNLQIFLKPEDGPAEHRFAMVHRSDYEVVDDWFMTGLTATGSRSIVVNEVFIPDYRSISNFDIQGGASPGSAVNPGLLYRLPFWGIGGRAFAGPAVGIALGALDWVEGDFESRVAVSGAKLAEQPTVHVRLAESGAEIEAAWALLNRDNVEAARMTEAGERPSLLQRTVWRRNNAYAVVMCVRAVDRLYSMAGMRGMEPDSDVQRAWRDVHAAASQVAIAWDPQAANYGRARFGLPFNDPRA